MAFPLPVWLAVQEELLGLGGPDCDAPSCFDDFDDDCLFQMFHLSRPCVAFIADAVRLRVKKLASKKPALSVDAMVMAALNYYAHGVSSTAVLLRLALSQAECLAVISTVSAVIAGMSDQFISFPLLREARADVASKIEELCGIPGALGVLAPAHFKIRASPYEKETFRSFVNSLGYTSVVSQIICDSDGNILSVEKCCVGSTCEQEMWESSFKGREVEEELHGAHWVIGFPSACLSLLSLLQQIELENPGQLSNSTICCGGPPYVAETSGGKGYQLSKHVLTPVSKPENDKEALFNEAHAKIHNVMRFTLGSLKRRFRCLMQLGFAQEGCLDKKSNIIKACCVLHNIAKKFSVPPPPVAGKIEHLHPGKKQSASVEINPEALKARQELIDSHFSVVSSTQDSLRKGSEEEE